MTDERALPRRLSKELGYWPARVPSNSRRWNLRPVHALRVTRVPIGKDHHGQPVKAAYPDSKALCRVRAEQADVPEFNRDHEITAVVTCPACLRELAKRGDGSS